MANSHYQRPTSEGHSGIVFMIRILLSLLICLLSTGQALADSLDKAELWRLCREGEDFFRQATELTSSQPDQAKILYEKALRSFDGIIQTGGIENGKLYYNIGNIYFRLGDLGRAILNYRKAEDLIPGDLNLQQNLMYARSRCTDRIEPKPQTRVLQTLFFWHYDVSTRMRLILFVICFDLIWAGAVLYLFWPKRWLGRLALAFAAPALLLAASLGMDALQQSHNRSGVVLAPEVIARKGDSNTYEASFKDPLHAGTEFRLIEDRNGWVQIELQDGRRCWIPDAAAGFI
jgi:tetratricopeptide (TPR) repeat protein